MEEPDLDETPGSQPATLQDLIELDKMILAAQGVLESCARIGPTRAASNRDCRDEVA